MSEAIARPKTGGRRLPLWIAVALVVHAELILVVGVLAYWLAPRDADLKALMGTQESIEIGTVDDETARRLLADLERAAEKEKQEEVKKEIESITPPGQVVAVPKPTEEQRPDDARFASEYDTKVAHETKRYGKFENSQAGAADGQANEARRAVAALAPQRPQRPTPAQEPSLLTMRKTARDANAAPAEHETRPAPEAADGILDPHGGGKHRPPTPAVQPLANYEGAPGLQPSRAQIMHAIGGGTQDALQDIDDGDTTALNSKKWKFASFFDRVKRQVAQHWDPGDEYNKRDPTGAIYGHANRYTLLRVRLKPDGSLAEVNVEKPSGMDFLDDTAVAAFRDAQPFPNPPRQLVEEGYVNFKFGFLLELSSVPRFRIFRFENQQP